MMRKNKRSGLTWKLAVELLCCLFIVVFFISVHAKKDTKENSIVALVNGEKITKTDLSTRTQIHRIFLGLKGIPEFTEFLMETKEGKKALDSYRLYVLEKLIEEKLILQKAESLGIKVEDKEVENRLSTIIKNTPEVTSKEELIKKLEKDQRNLQDLKEEIYLKLVREKLKRKIVEGVKASESEVQNYYDKNKDSFRDNKGEVKSLAKVKDQIRGKLREDKIEAKWEEWLEKTKKEAKIVRNLEGNS